MPSSKLVEANSNEYYPYQYALSITSQFYFCGVPFRLDTSPKCSLNCLYCFAMSRGGRRTSNYLIANVDSVRRKMYKVFDNSASNLDVNGEMLLKRVPVHFGGISDPFANSLVSKTSKELLSLLNEYNFPVIISTKNTNAFMEDKTMELLKEIKYLTVQISLSTLNRKVAEEIEPNAPSPEERIKCIQTLSKENIYTVVRLQPLFLPWTEKIAEELIPLLSSVGCKHVIIEHLKLPVEKNISLIGKMFTAAKWDGYEFYKKNNAKLIGREWILPDSLRWENLQQLIYAIHKYGMTYGSGDYGLNHLGDTDCCCGIDKLTGFSNWFKSNFSNVIRHASSNYIKFEEVTKYWLPDGSIKRTINSNCRLNDDNSLRAYLRKKWNSPGTVNAPDAFLGISWAGDYDEEGNCIYFKEEVK